MYNYTDLTLLLTVNKDYLADQEDIHVTFQKVDGSILDLTLSSSDYDITTGVITVDLSQQQTSTILGIISVQVNGFLNGKRWASNIARVSFNQNLLKQILVAP